MSYAGELGALFDDDQLMSIARYHGRTWMNYRDGRTVDMGPDPTPDEWLANWRAELRAQNPTVGIRIADRA